MSPCNQGNNPWSRYTNVHNTSGEQFPKEILNITCYHPLLTGTSLQQSNSVNCKYGYPIEAKCWGLRMYAMAKLSLWCSKTASFLSLPGQHDNTCERNRNKYCRSKKTCIYMYVCLSCIAFAWCFYIICWDFGHWIFPAIPCLWRPRRSPGGPSWPRPDKDSAMARDGPSWRKGSFWCKFWCEVVYLILIL